MLYGFKESQPVVFITAKCTRLRLHNPPSHSYSLCKAGLHHTCSIMRFPGTAKLWYSEHPGMVIFHEGLKKNRVRKCSFLLIKLWRELFKTTFIKNQTQWCYFKFKSISCHLRKNVQLFFFISCRSTLSSHVYLWVINVFKNNINLAQSSVQFRSKLKTMMWLKKMQRLLKHIKDEY